jgi:hypothetical protein
MITVTGVQTCALPICRPLNLDNIEFDQDYVIDIARRVEQTACKYFGTNVIDWAELFMRPPNTWHPYHTDDASEKTSITSVTYLNDGVNGGFTQFIDGTQVKPIAGRTIIFDGKKYVHGVSPVVEGVRYTMPIWYQSESK